MTQIDIAKLTALIPELEAWTGGERRDLDAKIAETLGWELETIHWGRDPSGGCQSVKSYLGTDTAIATEDMQRLVKDGGWCWDREDRFQDVPEYTVWTAPEGAWITKADGGSLPLAWVRAVVAKGEW